MYGLGEVVPDAEVPGGSNLLLAGPPMTGKQRLAMQLVAEGNDARAGAIVVSTRDDAADILDGYGELLGGEGVGPVGVVDCVTRQRSSDETGTDDRVTYAASPGDMTGIGIAFSEFVARFYERREVRRHRVAVDSLSTMLTYADLQTVFRFLHVFTNRVSAADAMAVYVIDSTVHDARTLNTLNQLFDGLLRVSEPDDGDGPTVELQGL